MASTTKNSASACRAGPAAKPARLFPLRRPVPRPVSAAAAADAADDAVEAAAREQAAPALAARGLPATGREGADRASLLAAALGARVARRRAAAARRARALRGARRREEGGARARRSRRASAIYAAFDEHELAAPRRGRVRVLPAGLGLVAEGAAASADALFGTRFASRPPAGRNPPAPRAAALGDARRGVEPRRIRRDRAGSAAARSAPRRRQARARSRRSLQAALRAAPCPAARSRVRRPPARRFRRPAGTAAAGRPRAAAAGGADVSTSALATSATSAKARNRRGCTVPRAVVRRFGGMGGRGGWGCTPKGERILTRRGERRPGDARSGPELSRSTNRQLVDPRRAIFLINRRSGRVQRAAFGMRRETRPPLGQISPKASARPERGARRGAVEQRPHGGRDRTPSPRPR